jgi:hypothetical protein
VTSSIVTPTDQIVITIDNRTGQAQMKCSRDLPFPYMMLILSEIMKGLSQQAMSFPQPKPMATPASTPSKISTGND